MISDSIIKFVTLLIDKVVVFAGLNDFTVPSDITFGLGLIEHIIGLGAQMLSFLFPTEEIYLFCINLTVDLMTATLVFEIISLWLRIYKTVRK